MEFTAKLNYVRVSPQKARLVLDLIKGRRVEVALDTLNFTKKGIAPALYKLLRSAVETANYVRAEKGLDVDVHLALGAVLDLLLQLVDLRTLAPDDDTRTRGADDDAQLVARALDLDGAHACRLELVLQLSLQLDVFQQQFVVVAHHEPARPPRLGNAEAKSVWMDLLSHSLLLFLGRLLARRLLCCSLLRRFL